jgi:hypothetical protein
MSVLPNSEKINSKHNDCEVVIINRLIKNQLHPKPGLYCENHGCLIKWVNYKEAESLKQLGVTDLGMVPEEQKIYNRRLRLMKDVK